MRTDWFSLLWERARAPLSGLSPDEFFSLLKPKCKAVITEDELKKLLASGRKLRVKLGVDVTGSELHLGHAVPLMLLNLFERAGHEIHFIIGDFTGGVGDPSGRTEKRVARKDSEIKKDMKTYVAQVSQLINTKKAKIHKNSAWLSKIKLAEFLRVVEHVSFGAVSQREDFRERLKAGSPVSLKEVNYASLMAIDSLHIKADVEVGAIDQLLNFMQTRDIMAGEGMQPESICVTPLIEGTAGDGRKMSKSFGNYIALADSPENQFGLVMRVPDAIIESYYIGFGDVYGGEIPELQRFIKENPLEAKKQLGELIAALLHGEAAARKAREDFERKFSKKEYSKSDAVTIYANLPSPLFDALVRAMGDDESRSQIRRLVAEGAVRRLGKHEEVLRDATDIVRDGDLLKVGKLHVFYFTQK